MLSQNSFHKCQTKSRNIFSTISEKFSQENTPSELQKSGESNYEYNNNCLSEKINNVYIEDNEFFVDSSDFKNVDLNHSIKITESDQTEIIDLTNQSSTLLNGDMMLSANNNDDDCIADEMIKMYSHSQNRLKEKNLYMLGNIFSPSRNDSLSTQKVIKTLLDRCDNYDLRIEEQSSVIVSMKRESHSLNDIIEKMESNKNNQIRDCDLIMNKKCETEEIQMAFKKEFEYKRKENTKEIKQCYSKISALENEIRKKNFLVDELQEKIKKEMFKDKKSKVKNSNLEIRGYMENKKELEFGLPREEVIKDTVSFFTSNVTNITENLRNELNKAIDCISLICTSLFEIVKKRDQSSVFDEVEGLPMLESSDQTTVRKDLQLLAPEQSGDSLQMMLENVSKFEDYLKKSDMFLMKYFKETKDQAENYAFDNEKIAHIESMQNTLENFKNLTDAQDQINSEIYRHKDCQDIDKENFHPNLINNNSFYKSAKDFLKKQSSMLNKKNEDVENLKGNMQKTDELFERKLLGISNQQNDLMNQRERIAESIFAEGQQNQSDIINYDLED